MDDVDAATRWSRALQGWGIPAEILERAPQSPWIHPTESFRPAGDLAVDTPSRRRALEALARVPGASSVLDIGCGGGRASLGLAPPADLLVGVDRQGTMLDVFEEEASARGVAVSTISGVWPDIAATTKRCDLVVCHHVVFNVPNLVPFVEELTAHSRSRVVIETPLQHPLANLSDAWLLFWGLHRPSTPTALDALAVIRTTGAHAHHERFELPDHKTAVTDRDVAHTRIRLCLPADRDDDVRLFLESRPPRRRELVTIWWDIGRIR